MYELAIEDGFFDLDHLCEVIELVVAMQLAPWGLTSIAFSSHNVSIACVVGLLAPCGYSTSFYFLSSSTKLLMDHVKDQESTLLYMMPFLIVGVWTIGAFKVEFHRDTGTADAGLQKQRQNVGVSQQSGSISKIRG